MRPFADLFGDGAPRNAREAHQLLDELLPEAPAPDPNPRARTGNNTPGIRPNPAPQLSLVESLYGVADDLRQLYTDFGMRPYRVWSVVYRWTGGGDGLGDLELVSELEFLPTPRVDLQPLRSEIKPAGEVTRGTVELSEISPRYTERQITGALLDRALTAGEVAFVEIRVDARDGATVRRRVTIADVPWRDPDKFSWRVTGYVQEQARTLDGALPSPTLYP